MGCLCNLGYCYINIVSFVTQIHEVQIKFEKMVAELFVIRTNDKSIFITFINL